MRVRLRDIAEDKVSQYRSLFLLVVFLVLMGHSPEQVQSPKDRGERQ